MAASGSERAKARPTIGPKRTIHRSVKIAGSKPIADVASKPKAKPVDKATRVKRTAEAAKAAKNTSKKAATLNKKSAKVVPIKSAKGGASKAKAMKNAPAKVKSIRAAAHVAKARPTKVKGGTKAPTRAAARRK